MRELGGRATPNSRTARRLHCRQVMTTTKENGNGQDRDERSAEHFARWSGPGPRRRGGLQPRRLVRRVRRQGPRTVEQGRARGGAARGGMAAGPAQLRVLRGAVATARR